MAKMHQIVVLTTHEVTSEGLRAIYQAAHDHSAPKTYDNDTFFAGTAFKLEARVELPDDEMNGMPALGPQNVVAIYGPLAT